MPGSTTRLGLPYPVGTDAVNVHQDIQNLATAIEAIKGIGPPIVTALTPGSQGIPNPVTNGFEVFYLADQTNGAIWHLKYRGFQSDGVTVNPSAYKWEFVGGSHLKAEVTAVQSKASGGAYGDLTTVGPSLVAPLAGDYEFEFNAIGEGSTQAQTVRMGIQIGATLPTDPADVAYLTFSFSQISDTTFGRTIVRNVSAAATTCKMVYFASVATGTWYSRALRMRPVRVG